MLFRKLTYLFFLLSVTGAYAQVDSAQVADTVLDSVNVAQVPTDSVAIANEFKTKASQALFDSLNNYVDLPVELDSTLTDQAKQEAKNRIEQEFNTNISTDSTAVVNKAESLATQTIKDQTGIEVSGIPRDSAAVKSEAKSLLKSEFANQTGLDVPDITIDSTTTDQINKEAEGRAEVAIKNTDEFQALEDNELGHLSDDLDLSPEQLKQMDAKKDMKQKMASQAKQFISQHTEQIQQVQEQMSELKTVYSEVPNSDDLSTAKKRGSLKGESFWKRLVIGGNLNLTETNPVTVDFSPVLGWKFNKAFEIGITGAYRAKFSADQNGINSYDTEDVYGYSVFAQHMAFKNFFGYLEGENISKVVGTEEDHKRQWNKSLLVGIGRKFKIAPFLEMQAIITYNFLHDNTAGVYNSPVGFKTGFRVVK
ncbi:MAG: hypothetical protein RLO12_21725 [Fulvivirga sp.]